MPISTSFKRPEILKDKTKTSTMAASSNQDGVDEVENIPMPRNWNQRTTNLSNWLERYMRGIGRGSRAGRQLESREALERAPPPQLLDSMMAKWHYLEPGKDIDQVGLYPNAGGTTFRAAANVITDNKPYGHAVVGGNNYFSAVAMLIYGDANAWYLVRSQHLQYLEQVIQDPTHPRHTLYLNFVAHRTGSTKLRLDERLGIPDCWVDHWYIQQVTADLYGIFLIVFTAAAYMSFISGVSCRGNYNSPHKFLCFSNGTQYNPLVPAVDKSSGYRYPEINLQATVLLPGVSEALDPLLNDGLLHPWRVPYEGWKVPENLEPTPIEVLGPIRNDVFERVLWVNLRAEAGEVLTAAERSEIASAERIVHRARQREVVEAGSPAAPNVENGDNDQGAHGAQNHDHGVPAADTAVTTRASLTQEQIQNLKDAAAPLRKIGDFTSNKTEYFFEEDKDKGVYYETTITTKKRTKTYVKADSDRHSDRPILVEVEEKPQPEAERNPHPPPSPAVRVPTPAASPPPSARQASSEVEETPIHVNWLSGGRDMTMKRIREECARRNISVPSRMRAPEVKRIYGAQLLKQDKDNAACGTSNRPKRKRFD